MSGGSWRDGWYVVPWDVMFRDIDAIGHVNNAVFFTFFEWGRTRYWFELQGGTAGGCGVPTDATVAMINFVAVAPNGPGNVTGASFPNAMPSAGSIINYQQLTPQLNIANGVLFPICDGDALTCTS